jgi:hypothetical protein
MTDSPRYPGAAEDSSGEATDDAMSGRPRWKTVMWILIVVAILALLIILHLTGVFGPEQHG